MIIKVCGMTDAANIQDTISLGADWIGMIFYPPSPRFIRMIPSAAGIMPDMAQSDMAQPSKRARRVGVFVDDMPQNIITRAVAYHLDIIQLHGNESPTLIRNLRATIGKDIIPSIQFIKAVNISSASDLKACEQYDGVADYLLFDTKCDTKGGCGRKFDWAVLQEYKGHTPFLLSGGIGPDDGPSVIRCHRECPLMTGIDINSRFETSPGHKDIQKLKAFINEIRQFEHE